MEKEAAVTKKPRVKQIKKMKIKDKGKAFDENDGPLKDVFIEVGPTLELECVNAPALVCFKFPKSDKYTRVEFLKNKKESVDLGPSGTDFEYRIVYEPDEKKKKEPFDGPNCKKVWSIPPGQFTGHVFGENTPTGGGEGGGSVGGGPIGPGSKSKKPVNLN